MEYYETLVSLMVAQLTDRKASHCSVLRYTISQNHSQ